MAIDADLDDDRLVFRLGGIYLGLGALRRRADTLRKHGGSENPDAR